MNRDPNFGFQNRKETFFPETSDNFIWGSTLNFLDHLKKCSRATNKLLVEIFVPKFCNVLWSMIHGIYWTENWTAGAFSDQWKYEDDNNDNKISSSWEFKNESKSILRLNCTDQSNVTKYIPWIMDHDTLQNFGRKISTIMVMPLVTFLGPLWSCSTL